MGERLGQHFLKNNDVARALARGCALREGEMVLEIGPGKGALTQALLETGANVVAVEKDEDLVSYLEEHFVHEIAEGQLRVVSADIRDVRPDGLGLEREKYVLAANIPYYITGEILRQFLTALEQPRTIALLIQKEVAERIVSEKESLLSLSVKAFGIPSILRKVPKGDFSPPPSVDSAILLVNGISRRRFASTEQEKKFFDLLHVGFSSKRKKLSGNLSRLYEKQKIEAAFKKLSIDDNARAENLSLDKWLGLVELLKK